MFLIFFCGPVAGTLLLLLPGFDCPDGSCGSGFKASQRGFEHYRFAFEGLLLFKNGRSCWS